MGNGKNEGHDIVVNFFDYRPTIREALDQALSMQRHPTYKIEMTEDERDELTSLLNMLDSNTTELLQAAISATKSNVTDRTLLNTLRTYFQQRR